MPWISAGLVLNQVEHDIVLDLGGSILSGQCNILLLAIYILTTPFYKQAIPIVVNMTVKLLEHHLYYF